MNPELMFVCPACFAPVGRPCNEPTDTGRRNVRWFHDARQNRAYGWSEAE